MLRPDLDGCQFAEEAEIWLVYHGRRHRVTSTVYQNLFQEVRSEIASEDLLTVDIGPDLVDGTCLLRGDGDLAIYLLVCAEVKIERCPILNWDSFCDFCFDINAVRSIPGRVLNCVPMGRGITSAASRVLRST